jgi:hypothetical protein
MHRGQGWAWEDRGGTGMAVGANELLPMPLPAVGEQYENQANMTYPGEYGHLYRPSGVSTLHVNLGSLSACACPW